MVSKVTISIGASDREEFFWQNWIFELNVTKNPQDHRLAGKINRLSGWRLSKPVKFCQSQKSYREKHNKISATKSLTEKERASLPRDWLKICHRKPGEDLPHPPSDKKNAARLGGFENVAVRIIVIGPRADRQLRSEVRGA